MHSNNPLSQPSDPNNITSAPFSARGWREKFILAILRIACVAGIALIAFSYSTATVNDRILFISLYVVLLAVSIPPVPYNIRAYALLAMSFAIGLNAILAVGPWVDGSLFLLLFIVLSALLLENNIDIYALIVSIITIVSVATLQQLGVYKLTNTRIPPTLFFDWLVYSGDFLAAGITIVIAIRLFKNESARVIHQIQAVHNALASERTQLEKRVQERTEELETRTAQLRSSTTVARIVAEIQNISELMDAVTKLTSEQFGYYHVGLYLLDENKRNAFLQAASSPDGKQMVGQGFRIEPDRRNAMYFVVEQNRSYIASDIGNVNFTREVSFPLTRSRMMLPYSDNCLMSYNYFSP